MFDETKNTVRWDRKLLWGEYHHLKIALLKITKQLSWFNFSIKLHKLTREKAYALNTLTKLEEDMKQKKNTKELLDNLDTDIHKLKY